MLDPEVKKEFNRLNDKLNTLMAQSKKETWITALFLAELTGWTRERMRQARELELIQHKRSEGGGWLYKLESIPKEFIRQNPNI